MYRLTKLASKWYAIEIMSIDDDTDNTDVFLDEGTPILFVNSLDDASEALDIEVDEIQLVERE